MIYKNRGCLIGIGVENIPGRKKKALTIRTKGRCYIVGWFNNEEAAMDFREYFERFIRGVVIDDRDRRSDKIRPFRGDADEKA